MPTGLSSTDASAGSAGTTSASGRRTGRVAAARRAVVDVGHLVRFRAGTVRRRRAIPLTAAILAAITLAACTLPMLLPGARDLDGKARDVVLLLPTDLRRVLVAHRRLVGRLGRRPRAAQPRPGRRLPGQPHDRPPGRVADGAAQHRLAAPDLGDARLGRLRAAPRRRSPGPDRDPALGGGRDLRGTDRRVDHGGHPAPAPRPLGRAGPGARLRRRGGLDAGARQLSPTSSTACPPLRSSPARRGASGPTG